jgi:hypothetical protein
MLQISSVAACACCIAVGLEGTSIRPTAPQSVGIPRSAADHPYVSIKSVQSRLVHRPISSESYIKKIPRERVVCARAAPAAHHMKG